MIVVIKLDVSNEDRAMCLRALGEKGKLATRKQVQAGVRLAWDAWLQEEAEATPEPEGS